MEPLAEGCWQWVEPDESMELTDIRIDGYERVVAAREPESGYHAVIAVHNTRLGPAGGGTRFWNYSSQAEALQDALRLARGMTYKNALAGMPLGGGKAVLIGDNRTRDRERIFRAHGRAVEMLGGAYITAEDVGTDPSDMEHVRKETAHVAGLASVTGDPSPVTARGVFRAMQAAAKYRWGYDNLSGKRIAVQGLGHVGYALAELLHQAGAHLIVSDVDRAKVDRAVSQLGASAASIGEIFSVEADVFAPCALGGILNDDTIPRLRAAVVVGAANNQLLEARHGEALRRRDILYAPDYAANAGGVISFGIVCLNWTREEMLQRVDAIYDTLLRIFALAEKDGIATDQAADRLAEENLLRAPAG